MRLVTLEADDEVLELRRELVGVAYGPAGSVGEGGAAFVVVAVKYFIAGFAEDAEFAADVGHRFSIEKAGDETEAFFHGRTRFHGINTSRPKAQSVTHVSRTLCHLCLGSHTTADWVRRRQMVVIVIAADGPPAITQL